MLTDADVQMMMESMDQGNGVEKKKEEEEGGGLRSLRRFAKSDGKRG